jgi:phage tail-like protein
MAEDYPFPPPARTLSRRPELAGTQDPDLQFGFKYVFNVLSKNVRGSFSSISGLSEEIEVVDQRDGTDPFQVRKIKGTHQGGSLTLQRGVVADRYHLIQWFTDVKKNKVPFWAEIDIGVGGRFWDQLGELIIGLTLHNGWPSKYELGELDARSSDIAVEVLTVAHEGLDFKM